VAKIYRSADPAAIDHYTVQRVMDVNASVAGRDSGSTTSDVQKAIGSLGKLPANQKIVIRGESQAMRESFITLAAGLVLAIVLVYLLMVANFQSWLEPFIITMAIPGALAGVLWMLIATGTTINVESLMGTIMAVGVGVSNGNLLITFANELREEGRDPVGAAIEAGRIRFPTLWRRQKTPHGMWRSFCPWRTRESRIAPDSPDSASILSVRDKNGSLQRLNARCRHSPNHRFEETGSSIPIGRV
jgi:multidrug efflux pump subunit AcrB